MKFVFKISKFREFQCFLMEILKPLINEKFELFIEQLTIFDHNLYYEMFDVLSGNFKV